jgi:hypothetical protein
MRVRMKTDVSGSRDGQPWPKRGESFEVSDAEGADLSPSPMATRTSRRLSPATPTSAP